MVESFGKASTPPSDGEGGEQEWKEQRKGKLPLVEEKLDCGPFGVVYFSLTCSTQDRGCCAQVQLPRLDAIDAKEDEWGM